MKPLRHISMKPVDPTEAQESKNGTTGPASADPTGEKVDIDALFAKFMGGDKKSPTGKKTKSSKPADPLKEQFNEVRSKVKKAAQDRKISQNGAGYEYVRVWNDDGTEYRMVPRARVEMAKILGRPVAEHERVFFVDRKKRGDDLYAPDNMVLGFKSGVPLDLLTCKCCGSRGNWTISNPSDGTTRHSAE